MMSQHTETEIPKKSFFKQTEVCDFTGVRPYVLRFWESEFQTIAPIVGENGQKLYEPKDIEAILLIKKLLFEDKLTIERAKFVIGQVQKPCVEEVVLENNVTAELPLETAGPSLVDKSNDVNSYYVKRSFTDSEWQKIILAKAKLNSIIANCRQIKASYGWMD